MIGRLTGQASHITNNQIILDVHGVGYLVNVPSRDLANLPSHPPPKNTNPSQWKDNQITNYQLPITTLHIHTHIKEDAFALYGFLDQKDLQLFKHLLTVSGVGPKLSLTILSQHTAHEISSAISKADTSFFQTISGIGKKNAQKIIVELKSKFGSLQELDLSEKQQQTHQDLIAALKSLGYNMAEIKPILPKIPTELTKVEDQIKFVLKGLK